MASAGRSSAGGREQRALRLLNAEWVLRRPGVSVRPIRSAYAARVARRAGERPAAIAVAARLLRRACSVAEAGGERDHTDPADAHAGAAAVVVDRAALAA